MDLAAVLEITAAETDVDATLSGSCCFYAAVAAAMAASADLPQKVRKLLLMPYSKTSFITVIPIIG